MSLAKVLSAVSISPHSRFSTRKKESNIEKRVVRIAEEKGWNIYKFVSPNNRGVPDRLAIKQGRCLFVEIKQPGKKPTKLQEHIHAEFAKQGFVVHVIDNEADARQLFHWDPLW